MEGNAFTANGTDWACSSSSLRSLYDASSQSVMSVGDVGSGSEIHACACVNVDWGRDGYM